MSTCCIGSVDGFIAFGFLVSGFPGVQTPRSSRTARAGGSARKKVRGKRDVLLDTSTQSSSSQSLLSQNDDEQQLMRHRNHPTPSPPSTASNAGQLEHPESCSDDGPIDEKSMGPLPENDQLFAGFAFILSRTLKPLEIPDGVEMTDDLEQYQDQSVPYHKEYIEQQIKAGGGIVLERFDHNYLTAVETDVTVLLVCNRPCRTERYIRSLAANIRPVSHLWVRDCCRKDQRLQVKSYYLPAGIDLDGNVIEWSPSTGRCLSGARLLLQGPAHFSDLWQPILMEAQCVVVFRLPSRSSDGEEVAMSANHDVPADYIITTADCPSRIIEQANRMDIPLVSSEWVIQSLIGGKKMDPKSRPQFSYNHAPKSN